MCKLPKTVPACGPDISFRLQNSNLNITAHILRNLLDHPQHMRSGSSLVPLTASSNVVPF